MYPNARDVSCSIPIGVRVQSLQMPPECHACRVSYSTWSHLAARLSTCQTYCKPGFQRVLKPFDPNRAGPPTGKDIQIKTLKGLFTRIKKEDGPAERSNKQILMRNGSIYPIE